MFKQKIPNISNDDQSPEESNSLKSRIYNKGFRIQTMPSVQRPKDVSLKNIRPLSAKVDKGELVFQPQSTVLHSQSRIAKTNLLDENFVPTEKKEEFSKIQEEEDDEDKLIAWHKEQYLEKKPSMPTQKISSIRSKPTSAFSKRPMSAAYNPAMLANINKFEERGVSAKPQIFKTKEEDVIHESVEEKKSVKKIKPMSAYQVGAFKRGFSATSLKMQTQKLGRVGSNAIVSAKKLSLLGNNFTTMGILKSDFTKDEMKRNKFIVDTITGKFNVDIRYKHIVWGGDNKERPLTTTTFFKNEKTDKTQITKKDENIAPKRPPSKLDKYIDMILKNVTNVDEFIYLKKINENDPYDLAVVNYMTLKEENCNDYYTISKKGLCHFVNGKPMEFISLAYWVKERETYDEIKSYTFFKKNFCYTMEQLRFVELSFSGMGGLDDVISDVPTLEIFKAYQEKKRKRVTEQIQEFSNTCRENIRAGFKDSLDILRKKGYNEKALEEDFVRKEETQNFFRLKESSYENLGFPDNMNYEKRAKLRKKCSKFIRFSYLVDFIAMEALKHIYEYSVDDLIKDFEALVKQSFDDPVLYFEKGKVVGKDKGKYKEPQFLLSIDSNFEIASVPANEIRFEDINEFVIPPIGESTLQDFNILYHVYLREEKKVDEKSPKKFTKERLDPIMSKFKEQFKLEGVTDGVDEEDEESVEVRDYEKTFSRKIIKRPSELWLSLKPGFDAFYSDLLRCVLEGMYCIQYFERWSKHDEMIPYVSVLEEWDDMVGDDWDPPDGNCLNPKVFNILIL